MPGFLRLAGETKNCGLIWVLLILFLLGMRNFPFFIRTAASQEIALKTRDFKVMETEHYVIKYTDRNEDSMHIVAKTAEEAYNEVCAWFGEKPSFKPILVVYPDTASLAASLGWDRDEKAMGVYWAGTIRILAPEAYLGPEEMKAKFKKEGPLVHEFAHLMVDEITRGNYNRWLTEGIAQYVEKKITGFVFEKPFADEKIKYYKLSELSRDFDRLNQNIAYWQSLEIIEYIAQVYGEDKIFSLLRYLGQGYNLNRALQEALGIPYTAWEQELYARWENLGREV
ncbi:Peptidase MA superfamily protein [Thermosyntropha lipolytica DSM 11003]|uniref:Peptidase MA superfamily protein n=1 Tax=Thermosyntropha lipolytica DSM 11003 TaxID=1123382 RepID=A0A1M5R4M8_9FIRM|nr:peptidase MA family metallohydrolase [Thermosyntropha lipolytica]SHH21357.1 Peptidase MA superfamily protein [Thermosyntropha lipolytica DSM 11003]